MNIDYLQTFGLLYVTMALAYSFPAIILSGVSLSGLAGVKVAAIGI